MLIKQLFNDYAMIVELFWNDFKQLCNNFETKLPQWVSFGGIFLSFENGKIR